LVGRVLQSLLVRQGGSFDVTRPQLLAFSPLNEGHIPWARAGGVHLPRKEKTSLAHLASEDDFPSVRSVPAGRALPDLTLKSDPHLVQVNEKILPQLPSDSATLLEKPGLCELTLLIDHPYTGSHQDDAGQDHRCDEEKELSPVGMSLHGPVKMSDDRRDSRSQR
jgi:hypothetical protein